MTCRHLCSQTVDTSKTASKSISSASTVNVDDDAEDDDSISEILEQCIRNAEDVESEFVREEEEGSEVDASHGESISQWI